MDANLITRIIELSTLSPYQNDEAKIIKLPTSLSKLKKYIRETYPKDIKKLKLNLFSATGFVSYCKDIGYLNVLEANELIEFIIAKNNHEIYQIIT